MKREHSLLKPYQAGESITLIVLKQYNNWPLVGTGTLIPFWDIKDDTFVTTDQIRLTPDIQSRKGALWNTVVSIISSERNICSKRGSK